MEQEGMDTAEGRNIGSDAGTGYTNMEARHITEVLDRKRKLLDDEIARFRAQKEEEYRHFERTFRDIIEKSVKKDNPKTRGIGVGGNEADRPTAFRTMFEGPASMQEKNSGYRIHREVHRRSELSRSLQEASTSGLGAIRSNVPMCVVKDKRSENIALRQASYDSPVQMRASSLDKNPVSSSRKSSSRFLRQDSLLQERRPNTKDRQPTHHHHSDDRSLTHERELEFQGLFIPHFLPLLDSSDHSAEPTNLSLDPHLVRRKHELLTNAPPDNLTHTAPQITPLTSRTSTEPQHLSLPTHTTSITNPPRLSSSIPARPPPSGSATLHSSLRSHTSKKPRSPKRVHFQIDNLVVPPSSTPPPPKTHPPPIVYAMPWPTKETSPSRHPEPATPAKASKVGVADAKEEGAPQVGERQMNREPAASGPAPASALAAASSSTRSEPAKDAAPAAATSSKPPASAPHHDNDDDDDDVFLLDEEIAARKDDKPKDDDNDDAKSTVSTSSSSSMKNVSPNATSLPIDIKYPVYVDPRDE